MYVLLAVNTILVLCLLKDHCITATTCAKDALNVDATLETGWKYEIQSPGFPNNYQPNQTCTWKVFFPQYLKNVHNSYQMMLVFDVMEIEPCTYCGCDWLAYSYRESDLPKTSQTPYYYKKCSLYSKNTIATLKKSGSSKIRIYSDRISSNQKEFWLRFHSDPFSEFKGFKGKITVVNTKASSSRCWNTKNIINETSGSISSPKYPSKYIPGQCIMWRLIVPNGFRVKLAFKAFELENDNYCLNDYVEIRDWQPAGWNGELLGRFCGSTIPEKPIFSLSNEMAVFFVSDDNAQTVHKGFEAHFEMNGDHRSNTLSHAVSGDIQVKPFFTHSALMMVVVIMKKLL